ncbi:cathepsin O-like [Mizuhopecten yessoensis]|uniref:Cathepsin O n=1 Tax=Mizuhopecten yessoensis TaxID=6573 RepID=A0A210QAG9_MIZYE|nr:cathepsin O-like [Mizuhopecten yessoensis]OWF45726.1 Cathepsin O [Mizuhopecten yessoensis]
MWNPIFAFTIFLLFRFSLGIDIFDEFLKYVDQYKKSYHNQSNELHFRFNIFKENLYRIEKLNQQSNKSSAWYGVNKFSDLTPEEFKASYLTDLKPHHGVLKAKGYVTQTEKLYSLNIPKKLDWRDFKNQSYVSAVKNQNGCGGCWAFSTAELVESMYSIQKHVPPPDLSVQEVIDCSMYNSGCQGGDTCTAMQWLVDSHVPLVSDAVYPLTDTSENCNLLPTSFTGVKVSNFTCQSYMGNEYDMLVLLSNGPLTVSVDATLWANYQGGIVQHHCGNTINHAVVIVGYDTTGDIPYYIVRNSWGPDFGINGYLHVKIGENICGIAGHVSTLYVV